VRWQDEVFVEMVESVAVDWEEMAWVAAGAVMDLAGQAVRGSEVAGLAAEELADMGGCEAEESAAEVEWVAAAKEGAVEEGKELVELVAVG
jgi:hypothetical protein